MALYPARRVRYYMDQLALLGDSVFDNGAYVGLGPTLITQVRQRLSDWSVTLMAADGSVIADIPAQLTRTAPSTTHFIISVGGNDALRHSGILTSASASVGESLLQLARIQEQFTHDYSTMLDIVLRRSQAVSVCTIYDPRYPDPIHRTISATALCVINDVIIRAAALRGIPVIDLRLVCNEDRDFANPIEPSVAGGEKIPGAITKVIKEHDFSKHRCEIFAG